ITDENAGSPWLQKLPISIPVPLSMTTDVGGGAPVRSVGYAVRDAFWDPTERRFGGFLEGHLIYDAGTANQRVEVTRFNAGLGAIRVLRGTPLWVRTDVGGQTVKLTQYTYNALAIDGLDATNPLLHRAGLMQEHGYRYEGVATPIETITTFSYDGEG